MSSKNLQNPKDDEAFLPVERLKAPEPLQTEARLSGTSQRKKQVPLMGYIVLILAMIGGASIGVLSNIIPAQGFFIKNAWRTGEIVIIVAPLAIVEYFYLKRKGETKKNQMDLKQYGLIVLQAFMISIWSGGVILGCNTLIQSQAYVLSNMHGFFIVMFLLFTGVKITRYEFLGMLLAALGCFCLVMDPNAERTDSSQLEINKLWALVITFVSSIFGAIFLMLTARSAASLPIFLLLLVLQSHLFVITSCFSLLLDPDTVFFSLNVNHGIFGFINVWDQPVMPIVLQGIFAGFFGQAGYTIGMLYFSPLVCSMCFLTEPLTAQLLGYALGIDKMPGLLTLLGGIGAILGLVFIEKGTKQRQNNLRGRTNDSFQGSNKEINASFEATNTSFFGGPQAPNIEREDGTNLSYEQLNTSHISAR